MKKRLIFVIPSLEIGGGEKSLINLLSLLNYNKYDVDLLLLNKSGALMALLPQQVRLLDLGSNYKIFSSNLVSSVFRFILSGKWKLAVHRLKFFTNTKRIKGIGLAEQHNWDSLKEVIPVFDNDYHAAIGFLEKTSIYIAVDRVKAQRKIGFIHTDYRKLQLNKEIDSQYFDKLNFIVTITKGCEEILKAEYEQLANKIMTIHNITSLVTIKKKASEKVEDISGSQPNKILSIGRLEYVKGFDLAIDACRIIKSKGVKFKWYIVGEGSERNNLETQITQNNLKDIIILLGAKLNPYPYLKLADIYVQPSRYEGKSIAIDEAKLFQKPIVATNFTTIGDQIQDKVNGLICDMTPQSLAETIIHLINTPDLVKVLIDNLAKEKDLSECELEKFYNLIEV